MATLKQIRKRIRTATNIQQITRAMKLVAAARLRRATERVLEARPYSEKLRGLMGSLASTGDLPPHPLLERREVRRIGVILISSDRGLAGSFNTNLIRKTADFAAAQTIPVRLITMGKKGTVFFTRRGYDVAKSMSIPAAGARLSDAVEITTFAREQFESGEVDAIYICYSKFLSAMRQLPQLVQLLPIEPPEGEAGAGAGLEFEPSPEAILGTLLPRYFQTLVWQAMLESTASQFGAQMTAMTSATDNAGKMISSLTLKANRERQAAITKEILEVVGGAEALKA
ncbi:MAG: ATP synthase F1 subunit gamma [Fimbriimonas ginsengisoli]|uniref:ATP synthase gamma chain n=1 Tax=Fimbriimonas ginsengisoli TaxID=1005039 RepID=A0A931PTX0_FIMGI|nr:ATP synthase F1 subunit gamma [Fimbriimonas ginsengisoli]